MEISARNKRIIEAVLQGAMQSDIADALGISRQRVNQIARKYCPEVTRGNNWRKKRTCSFCGKETANKKYCSHICMGASRNKNNGEMRLCSRCNEEKHKSEYYVINRRTGQLSAHCRKCQSDITVRYTNNRIASGDVEFVKARREATIRYAKKHYHSDPEYRKKVNKKKMERYYSDPEYREREKERSRAWYHERKDVVSQQRKERYRQKKAQLMLAKNDHA